MKALINYHEYIKSQEWHEKSDEIKQQRGYRCQLCNVSGFASSLHAHHKTYERLGEEHPEDITILCTDCHRIFHENKKVNEVPKLDTGLFVHILRANGVHRFNSDPYAGYENGKRIIRHILDGFNQELYDYYNAINISILDAALANQEKRDAVYEAELDD